LAAFAAFWYTRQIWSYPSEYGYLWWEYGNEFPGAVYDTFGLAENQAKLISEFGNTVPGLVGWTDSGAISAIGEIKSGLTVGDWGNVGRRDGYRRSGRSAVLFVRIAEYHRIGVGNRPIRGLL
jgi:hypothetical protein